QAYNLRGNFTFDPLEDVNISLSNSYVSSKTAYNYNDGESWGYIGAVLLGQPEWTPVRKSDPNQGGAPIVTCPLAYETARTSGQSLADVTATECNPDRTFIGSNNFARLETMDNQAELERYVGSASITFEPTSFWTVRGTAGYDAYTERGWDMIPNVPLKIRDADPTRTVTDVLGRTLTLEGATGLTFALTPTLNSETTFGIQYFKTSTQLTQAQGYNFPPGAPTVGNGATRDASEDFLEVKTLGLFVQQQFAYLDRVFLTPAVRFDNNSAFGANLGAIIYPRISLSYVIGEEAWFPAFFDEMRLRGAWGTSGKQPGAFDAATLLSVNSVTLPDGSSGAGFAPSRTGNADLKPETGSEIELGFDAGFWKNRLGLEFTYFNQVTRDALVLRPVPPSTGFSQGVWDNVGEVKNSGFELGLNADLLNTDQVSWSMRFGFTHVNSEITKLDEPIAIGGRGLQEHREGYAFGAYFMRPVFINEAGEVEVAEDWEYVGQPTPTYDGSVSSTLSLFEDRIRIYAQAGFMGGHKQINYTEVYQCRTAFGTCAAKYERDANGEFTEMARLKADPNANFQPYHFLYDADFLKLRTLSVQYNLPSRLIGRLGGESASIRLVGTNLLTITDYPGVDPEINSQGRQNASQREFFSAGQTRRYTLGLTLSF
ncbi:MAG: TonB-dependent receptor domain-containing protein, partial [Rhodothermales bacterium]